MDNRDDTSPAYRCGYIAIIGRPNTGKSTLMNELIGAKISITSRKAQTTRHRIMGIQTDETAQFVYIDTPGFQTRHTGALNRNLNRTVRQTLADADVIVFVVEAGVFGDADRQVLDLIPENRPVVLVMNKTDRVRDKEKLLPFTADVASKYPFAAVVPVSATQRYQLKDLEDEIRSLLPENPPFFDEEDVTDKSERFMAAEVIREKIFRFTGDELPYTSTVVIEQFERKSKLCRIFAAILVERESHKSMIIGTGGEKLKEMSTQARLDLEKIIGLPVYLEVWVKVKSGWADNEMGLKAYGYE